MTKIDILLPYWGDVTLFKKAVDSVLFQTSSDWSLKIFDDHYPSTEAQEYIESLNDKRISYVRHEKNIGITKNFNFAVNAATADHCVLIGSDDKLLPNFVERSINTIGNADFYQPGVEVIDDNDQVYKPLADRIKLLIRPKKAGIYAGEKLITSLCHGNWLYFPSIVWKTSTLKRYMFNESYKIVEDLFLEFSIITNGGTLQLDNEISFQYRRSKNSLSSKEKSKDGIRFKEEQEIYLHFSKELKKIGWNKAANAAKLRITSRIHELMS